MCEKFHYDRLRNDKALGNGKSDNKKNNKKNNVQQQQQQKQQQQQQQQQQRLGTRFRFRKVLDTIRPGS